MGLSRSAIVQGGTPLCSFRGSSVRALGQIELSVTFGSGNFARMEDITFDVVDLPYQYNTTLFLGGGC